MCELHKISPILCFYVIGVILCTLSKIISLLYGRDFAYPTHVRAPVLFYTTHCTPVSKPLSSIILLFVKTQQQKTFLFFIMNVPPNRSHIFMEFCVSTHKSINNQKYQKQKAKKQLTMTVSVKILGDI